jgi:hypothetical protein
MHGHTMPCGSVRTLGSHEFTACNVRTLSSGNLHDDHRARDLPGGCWRGRFSDFGGAVRCRLLWAYGIHNFGAGNLYSLPGRNFLDCWYNGLHWIAVPCRSVRSPRGSKDCRRGSLLPPAVGFVQRINGHAVQSEWCKYAHKLYLILCDCAPGHVVLLGQIRANGLHVVGTGNLHSLRSWHVFKRGWRLHLPW